MTALPSVRNVMRVAMRRVKAALHAAANRVSLEKIVKPVPPVKSASHVNLALRVKPVSVVHAAVQRLPNQ